MLVCIGIVEPISGRSSCGDLFRAIIYRRDDIHYVDSGLFFWLFYTVRVWLTKCGIVVKYDNV